MDANAFANHATKPTASELKAALGASAVAWERLLAELKQDLGAGDTEWKSYSLKAGWALRVIQGKRTIIWLGPRVGQFQAALVLGGKAMLAVRKAKWPKRILTVIETAPKYPEGTGIRLRLKSEKDIPVVMRLAAIKAAN